MAKTKKKSRGSRKRKPTKKSKSRSKAKSPKKTKKKKASFPKWLSKYYALKTLNPSWSKKRLYKEAGKPGAK